MRSADSFAAGPGTAGVPEAHVESVSSRLLTAASLALREFLRFLQFAVFLLYLAFGVIGFWVWVLSLSVGLVRLTLKLTRQLLLLLALLNPPPEGWTEGGLALRMRAELRRLWGRRLLFYADVTRPAARQVVAWSHSARRFWHLPFFHKLVSVLVAVVFVGVPLAYLIPRPHYVQITDRNSFSHADGQLRALIHAIDLSDPSRTREYENEYAFYLGKINPQGLKAQLREGHFYRLLVVGLRWNYLPQTLYPNIISATEINKDGTDVDETRFLPVPFGETLEVK